MSASDVAIENFKNLAQNVMGSWPFILGFSGIEFVHAYLRSLALAGSPQDSMSSKAITFGLLGLNDTAKFAYWNNYVPPQSS